MHFHAFGLDLENGYWEEEEKMLVSWLLSLFFVKIAATSMCNSMEVFAYVRYKYKYKFWWLKFANSD